MLWPCTFKHDFYLINWTFTGFIYSPTDFCSSLIPYDLYTILTRLSITRGVDFMFGCIYGLVRSLMVLYDRLYDYTWTWHPCQFFKSFKNHTQLSWIHSNGPSVTRIRPRLYVRFTRMANHISRVFCVRQALVKLAQERNEWLVELTIHTCHSSGDWDVKRKPNQNLNY